MANYSDGRLIRNGDLVKIIKITRDAGNYFKVGDTTTVLKNRISSSHQVYTSLLWWVGEECVEFISGKEPAKMRVYGDIYD